MFTNTKKLHKPARYLVLDQTFTDPLTPMPASRIGFLDRQAGYFGIRYHHVIQRDGTIEDGRPSNVQSPLTRVANDASLCVVLVGGKSVDDFPSRNFTPEQEQAVEKLAQRYRRDAPELRVCLLDDLISRKNRQMLFNIDRYNP